MEAVAENGNGNGKKGSIVVSHSLVSDLIPDTTLSQEAIEKICDRLPELHRGKKVFGRKNSQTTSTLMTMTMIADTPYRQMKQCLAQIDGKRNALVEAYFTTRKLKIKIKRWEASDDELDHIEAEESKSSIETMKTACEHSMKEIGMYQDIYEQIRISHNIPVDWDEEDFEATEIDNALRMGFRQAIQNMMATGRVQISTVEYWEQFGVHPIVGEKLVREYLLSIEGEMEKGRTPSVVSMHDFLDKMVEMFKDEHKHSLTRIGVDAVINHTYAYKKKKKKK